MTRGRRMGVTALAALHVAWLLGVPGVASAQDANRAAPGNSEMVRSFRIAGTAVNARTGEVLAQARISVEEATDPTKAITVVTGSDGHFAFTGLKAAKYILEGSKRGFLPGAYDQHEGYSTAIVTGVEYATDTLKLRLMPMALITGHIYDEFGEGVRAATVALYYENRSGGMSRIVKQSTSSTDDRGFYDFSLLRPGNYYIAVTAKPWYAVHAPPGSDALSGTTNIPPALDVAYPTTYYGGATESDSATAIAVAGGDELQIDLRVSPKPALRMTFRLPEKQGEGSGSYHQPTLQKRVFDSMEPVEAETFDMSGRAEISGVPPGRYTVQADNASSGQLQQSEDVDLQRDGQEFDDSRSQPLGSVKVTLKMLGGETLPKPYLVALLRPRQRAAGIRSGDDSGQITIEDLAPGSYAMRVVAPNKQFFVTRVTSASGDSAGHDVTVAAGTELEVTALVSAGNVTIEGAVQKNGKPVAGVMVALIPKDPENHVELFRRDQSDFDGTFHVAGVIPGTYTLVAVEDAWGFEWLQPGVLARYAQHGQELTVGELMRGTVHLPEPVEVQPR